MEILSPMELRAIEKGRVHEARDKIARLAHARFGSDEEFRARLQRALEGTDDSRVLDRWFDRAITAATREEFENGLAIA